MNEKLRDKKGTDTRVLINSDTIKSFVGHSWHVNTGNFNRPCPICRTPTKEGDQILIEMDTTTGLTVNTYCEDTCGNIRLTEFVEYYTKMKKNPWELL